MMLKHRTGKNKLSYSFRDCTFDDLHQRFGTYDGQVHVTYVPGERPSHPLLSQMLVPILHLSLVKINLYDPHLDLITPRLNHVELVDISFNRFNPDSLMNFVNSINRVPNRDLALRTLSLAGNSLKTSSERLLATAMIELLLKRAIVHLDLSLTDLEPFVLQKMCEGFRYARTLQSLHVSVGSP